MRLITKRWIGSNTIGNTLRRSIGSLALILACASSADLSAAQLQIPATHPRLFYANASRGHARSWRSRGSRPG